MGNNPKTLNNRRNSTPPQPRPAPPASHPACPLTTPRNSFRTRSCSPPPPPTHKAGPCGSGLPGGMRSLACRGCAAPACPSPSLPSCMQPALQSFLSPLLPPLSLARRPRCCRPAAPAEGAAAGPADPARSIWGSPGHHRCCPATLSRSLDARRRHISAAARVLACLVHLYPHCCPRNLLASQPTKDTFSCALTPVHSARATRPTGQPSCNQQRYPRLHGESSFK